MSASGPKSGRAQAQHGCPQSAQKRTWAREIFANQIANQLCVTARYWATQDEMIASAFLQIFPKFPTRSGLWWLS
jgi:hypothetical protein